MPQQTAVFMYSTAGPDGQTVTLQLRETDEAIELPSSVLSKMSRQADSATLSISYQDSTEVLTDGTIDLLLATTPLHSTGDGQSTDSPGFELFDSENGHDLTLSPQTFTANTTADSFLVNDNSNSVGMSVNESDTVGSSEDVKSSDLSKLNMARRSKPVAKAMSPNRQGPQQCLTCGKVFGNASALAKHKLTHSDERKYVCNVCSKAFKRQDHLNGHMLTHRHKKPFECKANGCGKSYCDARSLRRHTENHHHHQQPSSNQGSPPSSPSSSTSSGCIQYAPAPLASPPSSTTTTTTTTSTGTATTTLQQQQQIQSLPQSQSQSQTQDTPSQLQKLLSAEPLSCSSPGKTVNSTNDTTANKQQHLQTPSVGAVQKPEQKPVECNLCHRKFKNVPALNGHMRLHGGYFKKETDSKKWEKKETSGPPLQTASMSVRALIEEKIIQKRTTKPTTSIQNGMNTYNSLNRDKDTSVQQTLSRSTVHTVMSNNSVTSFAIPALPSTTVDTTTSTADTTSVVYTDILLKKTGVKRACSDPGYQFNQSSSTSPQIDINYTSSPYTLNHGSNGNGGNGEKDADNQGYYSPGLNDDIFPNVQTDTMLLQAVDSVQLADTIQATDMQDMSCLDDYDGMTDLQNSEDFQAVLNSPLSASLADLAYSSGQTMFTDLGRSPLPSPSFTYPTPPASQEGQSPSLNFHSVMSNGHLGDFFYSSDMSSSEAVEAALSEVLPNFESATDSPLSANTPVPSPMSLPNSSAAPSPLPNNNNHHQHTLQVMMPNSEDPLLSSSPKEFRKKFDYQTCRLYGVNGTMAQVIDGSQFLIDKNGDLKLVHASYQNPGTMFVQTEAQLIDKSTQALKQQQKQDNNQNMDDIDDLFINPSSIQSNQSNKVNRKRCFGEISSYKSFRSRLRCHRLGMLNEPTLQYTPKPMLSPSRNGRGLYWQAVTSWPSSTTVKEGIVEDCVGLDSPPECDVVPHINLGSNFQAIIPPVNINRPARETSIDYLLWDPYTTNSVAEREVEMYMDFACCAAVPGGGRNKEYALHLLHLCKGNVQEAMLKLMQPTPYLPQGHPLMKFEYTESDHWTQNEVSLFHKAVFKYDKDFSFISQELGTKTLKQCVQFYYLWKKVCPEDYKQFQLQRRKSRSEDTTVNMKLDIPANDLEVTTSSGDQQTYVCEFSDCLSSFNNKIGLVAHMRLHNVGTPDRRQTPTPTQTDPNYEEFPCKICGKVFNKVKSRSAHMKSHRPPDAEPKKPKLDQNVDYGQMMQLKTVATPIQLHRQC
ncbi:serine-rich adhesin for platelets-like isoform X2 [Daktulosphaira vitifoliae]|uniref:serine-rich adhesin for platelets-like isoform X2 n=2 Tax=Daktulosphaira vitifoliae TaxID=58002 RepID=UPI0021A9944C|nr:serine-rich adhesin for platelets-like isoform X2 [Daktulosphaira vitifoliae]